MRSIFICSILLAGLAVPAGSAIAQDSQIKGVPQDTSYETRYTDQRGYTVRHSEQRNRPAVRQAEQPAIRGSEGPRIEKVTPEEARKAAREAAQHSRRKAARPAHREASHHQVREVGRHDNKRGRAAFGSVSPGETGSTEVRYNDGTLVGQDPDANVRLMLLKNNARTLWSR
jgi:hypothetical protein